MTHDHEFKLNHWPGLFPTAVALVVVGAGCMAKQYQKQADRETYAIVQEVEQGIFGRTNQFSIDTAWSQRDPDSILAPEIVGTRTETNRLTLTLEQALDLAARQSRRYQTEKERLYLTALSLTGERYEFGPQFFATSDASYARSTSGEKSGSLASQIGVSQLLKTGGRLSVSLANDLLRYYTGDPRRETINTLSMSLTQPLLAGFGKNNPAVEQLTQAERNVVYAVRSYSYFQREYAITIVNDYFNLLGQKNIIRNTYSNYISQVQSTKRLEARYLDEALIDVDRARSSELSAKNNYVNAIATYFNSLDAFKLELGVPLGVRLFLDDEELKELEKIGLIAVDLDRSAAFRLATGRNYNLLNAIDQFEDTKRKLRLAADQLRADLNFVANASLTSLDTPTDYTQFDLDNVRYSFGLELDLPIDRLRERNAYRAAIVNFEADIRNLALELDSLKDLIERGLRTLEQRRQNHLIQQNALELANRRVESSQSLLVAGRATVLDLVDAQNEQISAQNSVTAALVSYQANRLQLLLTLGIIETESEKFWFRSQLESAPDIVATESTALELPRDQLIPPDDVFNN